MHNNNNIINLHGTFNSMIFYTLLLILAIIPNKVRAEQEDVCLDCVLQKTLSNGNKIPLVGLGVGNLQKDLLDDVLNSTLHSHNFRLIDTARQSGNEKEIGDAIAYYEKDGNGNEDVIHIVTKVWYTYLGYDRTKISVHNTMDDIAGIPNIRLHILLHWPRCYDDISWMDCEGEETKLVDWVQSAGPAPHLDKENAWKHSWRALEDLYTEQKELREKNKHKKKWKKPIIESIGISNFEFDDMEQLVKIARVMPHIYQGNLWKVVHDPYLMNLLNNNNIHFQAYNIMNGAVQRKSEAPNAFSVLTKLSNEFMSRAKESTSEREHGHRHEHELSEIHITEAMVIMAWLTQEGIAIIPRASSTRHQVENSPSSINSVPQLSNEEKQKVRAAVSALMKGKDLSIKVTFQNKSSQKAELHWANARTGEEIRVLQEIAPGSSKTLDSHPGHEFVAYSDGKKTSQRFTITAFYGDEEDFAFDEL